MSSSEKVELICRNLQEVIGRDELESVLRERNLRVYWGTATTGKPHIAYFLPILKIRDFLLAECDVKILIADIHAFLDNLKAPIDLVNMRVKYYKKIIVAMLKSLDIDTTKIKFVVGSVYQKSERYVMDLYRLSTVVTERDAKKAGSQVVKQVDNPALSSLIYPSMQALDEEYLEVDAQFGGVDQRKIFTFAMKYLPVLGYRKRIHLMNPMIDGLNTTKMSSSDVFSKIDLIDDIEAIRKKIKKCYCAEGDTSTSIFQLLEFVVFPIFAIKGHKLQVKNQENQTRNYESVGDLKEDFFKKLIHPGDLKNSAVQALECIVMPVREEMLRDQDLISRAYPTS